MWAGADIEDRRQCASRLSRGVESARPEWPTVSGDWWPVVPVDRLSGHQVRLRQTGPGAKSPSVTAMFLRAARR